MENNNRGMHLTIRYRGGDADKHHVRLRKLGESLMGVERLVSVGLYVVEVGKLPSPRQRLRYVIQATQPQAGSVEIGTLMEQAYWMGPLFWGGPTSSDSPRAKLRWIPMVSRALGDLG